MAKETQLARLSMERNLAFLGTVGNNAPFVGLLGTVIGVIRSFHELNASGGALANNPIMATGLCRIGYAADHVFGGGGRALAHSTSGPCLQQNLICILEGRA